MQLKITEIYDHSLSDHQMLDFDYLAEVKHECKLQSDWLMITTSLYINCHCPINTLTIQ